jgi:hypothetical protein
MKQITWLQAEEIAEQAARKALGISPPPDGTPVKVPPEQMRRIAADAVVIALRAAGCLANQDNADRRSIERAANQAEARHRAWSKATGSKF